MVVSYGGIVRRLAHQARCYATAFKEGDHVLIYPLSQDRAAFPFLSKTSLTQTGDFRFKDNEIKHATVIGKRPGEIVSAINGALFYVQHPTLAEHVCLSRRLVTPISPENANIIVSLLDIHPPLQNKVNEGDQVDEIGGDEIHILEAGTGHGALTLHIARALHACNPPPPQATKDQPNALAEWKRTKRKAVLHTLDISAEHSRHAENHIINTFRRAIYAPNVDFHVGDLSTFFETYFSQSRHDAGMAVRQRFLSHVVLDMPNSNERLAIAAKHMCDDALLLVFNPSVTQLVECVERIAEEKLPLQMYKVIELAGALSGGREWDVRTANIRKPAIRLNSKEQITGIRKPWSWIAGLWPSFKVELEPTKEKKIVICRPKAGAQIPVGGFVGIWKRKKD